MELGLERTHQVLTSLDTASSSTLSLTALNADASWLLTLNHIVRIAIDPWLVGDEIDGCSWFNTQSHAYPCVSPSDVGIFLRGIHTLDMIMCTQATITALHLYISVGFTHSK